MKHEMSLAEIKAAELNILRHFSACCRQEGLRFYLSNGTLLGAVKYGGFIPWDDDIDVMMPRSDYDRFIRIYNDTEKYRLYSPERCGCYRFPFAKLCDTDTLKVEYNVDNGTELGLDIDIFPIDNWADDLSEAKDQVAELTRHIKELMFLKQKTTYSANPVKRAVKAVLLRLMGDRWQEKISKINNIAVSGIERAGPKFTGCMAWCMYGEREILPAETFSAAVDMEFEGDIYPAPVGYDMYLSSLYGDYRKDPPEEKQRTHHNFKSYKRE